MGHPPRSTQVKQNPSFEWSIHRSALHNTLQSKEPSVVYSKISTHCVFNFNQLITLITNFLPISNQLSLNYLKEKLFGTPSPNHNVWRYQGFQGTEARSTY
ncbi:hypothetical protein JTB14_010847 [Gonioctena quinquepunctata]|nr:hypothetical protein JTB14_010847 [Gonioctena quinquepunctata]